MKNFNIDLSALKSFSFKSFSLPVNLQQRDKLALMIAGMVLGIYIVLQLTVFPILNRRTTLREKIHTHRMQLVEMQELQAEHGVSSQNNRDVERQLRRRLKNFTLFSFIDQLAGKTGIKNNITSMKPSTTNLKNSSYALSAVEMKISALTMEQLTPFLHGIESNNQLIWIKRISIAKGSKTDTLLDVVLQGVTVNR